jgi:hypothetical protein
VVTLQLRVVILKGRSEIILMVIPFCNDRVITGIRIERNSITAHVWWMRVGTSRKPTRDWTGQKWKENRHLIDIYREKQKVGREEDEWMDINLNVVVR